MSFVLDVNLLLYASDASSPFHQPARAFLDRLAEGAKIAYLFWPVISGYLRIATHPAVFATPLSPDEAVANIDELLSLPHIRARGKASGSGLASGRCPRRPEPGANLVPDAHVVALMQENGVRTIWTHDRDYRRFDGVEVRDPFE